MRVALAQINPTIADLEGNRRLIEDAVSRARTAGADLVALPELCVCGYPPRDLLLRRGFADACERTAREIGAAAPPDVAVVLGTPRIHSETGRTRNSVLVFRNGETIAAYDKRLLPNYDVFDEERYFEAGDAANVFELVCRGRAWRVGLAICEDLWRGEDAGFGGRYARRGDPMADLAAAAIDVLVCPSATPFVVGKDARHVDLLARRAAGLAAFVVSPNQVGGNDDLVFDGGSCVLSPEGACVGALPRFEAGLCVVDLAAPTRADRPSGPEEREICDALRLGVRDYFAKSGFSRAIVGISGGIDSAVTAAIGVASLGADHILGVRLPGPFSSEHSLSDAADLAERLGIRCVTVRIGSAVEGVRACVDPAFSELDAPVLGAVSPDVAFENLQSRARGTILMTLANRIGALLLTTGNKSELAVGYCTLYGDMNGALAVLHDVYKTRVFHIARWMNTHYREAGFARPPIPETSIEKPPSAELADGQLDSDSLPPYDTLDAILEQLIEGRRTPGEIMEAGYDADTVRRVARLVRLNEHKRWQAAIGPKVTSDAFGPGWRMPLVRV